MFDGTLGKYTGSKKSNYFQWATTTVIIPKINGAVRFISDFRQLNKI